MEVSIKTSMYYMRKTNGISLFDQVLKNFIFSVSIHYARNTQLELLAINQFRSATPSQIIVFGPLA